MKYLESLRNKTIKDTIALSTKKERDKTGLFVLEGERLVSEIDDPDSIEYIIVSESYDGEIPNTKNAYLVSDELFAHLSDTVHPQGILAVCHKLKYNIDTAFLSQNPLFVILENLQDPGNLGTIIRTADAAGADAVFLSKGTVDLYNPKVVRSTMGAIFRMNIVTTPNLLKTLQEIKRHKFEIVATSLETEKSIYDISYHKKVVVIGNEAKGISKEIQELADKKVKIPMLRKNRKLKCICSSRNYDL